MTNKHIEAKARTIVAMLEPSLYTRRRLKGKYMTTYGAKTKTGLVALVFNVIATP